MCNRKRNKKSGANYKEPVEVIKVPMADGGEGTVEAIVSANGGRIITTQVLDPLGREVDSFLEFYQIILQ